MSQFLSGAAVDCGPSNVLKNVGGRLERDFSLQQVCPDQVAVESSASVLFDRFRADPG
jgi:hypothetical protein